MLKRIFMTIGRGITDKTPVCIYPWEQPIVEEIHHSQAQLVSLEEMCAITGHARVTKLKFKRPETEDGLTLRQQYEAMITVSPDDSPLHSPEAEWDRMVQKYGMHTEINISNAEKVFGNFAAFRRCMRDYAAGRIPDMFEPSGSIDLEPLGEKPIADMTFDELKVLAKEKGVTVGGKKRDQIELELMDLNAEAA